MCCCVQVNGVFAGHTALQAASQNGHVELIKVLMKYDINMEVEVRDAFTICSKMEARLLSELRRAFSLTRK